MQSRCVVADVIISCIQIIMILFLFLSDTLVPVITVGLHEPVTFTCFLPDKDFIRNGLQWYKQSVGDNLKLILTLQTNINPTYEPEFSESRFKVNHNQNIINLTIVRTLQEDEGMYHCAVRNWNKFISSATYLSLKGNYRTSNYSVVQSTVSDPVRPGDSVTLQCSVLSDSESDMCPRNHSVYWFRAGSDESHPNIIYTDGNNECEKRSDTVKSCVYHFSKNISSSDAGTYYCAVATCGQILFGDGTKLDIASSEFIALVISVICLVVSVTGNIVFICSRNSRPANEQFKVAPYNNVTTSSLLLVAQPEDGHDLNYAALHFSGEKATRGRKKKEMKNEDSVYSQIKCS
uniref:Ig-like domain-containing protein n=1 Tax=Mastacembelus armatus TaxID=205130 RepID=A0A3Q3N5M4_9TELE